MLFASTSMIYVTHTHTNSSSISPTELSFIILTILPRQTLSTRCHNAKTTTAPQLIRITTWDTSISPQVEAAVTTATGTHPILSQGTDPSTGVT